MHLSAHSSIDQKLQVLHLGLTRFKLRCQPDQSLIWRLWEESSSNVISELFLTAVRPTFSCWLSCGDLLSAAGGHSQVPSFQPHPTSKPATEYLSYIISFSYFEYFWFPLLPPAWENSLILMNSCDWVRPIQIISLFQGQLISNLNHINKIPFIV